MTVTQAALALFAVIVLGGGLWACYMCIKINDADEAERRKGQ